MFMLAPGPGSTGTRYIKGQIDRPPTSTQGLYIIFHPRAQSLDDPEKFLLSREMSDNDGIIVGREKQIIRKGSPFREKQVRGDKVRTRNPGVFIEINY